MEYRIGIDIGGTKINGLLIDKRLSIKKKIKIITPKTKKEFLKQLICLISGLLEGVNRRQVKSIGCGVPGIMDEENKNTLHVINLPFLNNFHFKSYIENKFHITTKLANDALCAGLFEYHSMKKKPHSFVVITLGTGIGAGAIIQGTPIAITEPGHLTIDMNGIKDSCGNTGCLEQYTATKFIRREAKKHKLPENPELLVLTQKGRRIMKEMGKNLGIGLSDIVKLFNPGVIVFAGGLMKTSKFFLPEAIKELKKRTFFKPRAKFRISTNQENTGALGAALL